MAGIATYILFLFIQFTAIKSNQKQHSDKREYSWGATRP